MCDKLGFVAYASAQSDQGLHYYPFGQRSLRNAASNENKPSFIDGASQLCRYYCKWSVIKNYLEHLLLMRTRNQTVWLAEPKLAQLRLNQSSSLISSIHIELIPNGFITAGKINASGNVSPVVVTHKNRLIRVCFCSCRWHERRHQSSSVVISDKNGLTNVCS